ncbi:hypothetical protein [Paenibacillus sp. S28]|uniref:hypothetical protein n=1 Tax=Paenibacillus sp. S28 TaxID=2767463 RepID=UPI00190CD7BE|nr:hypothetical protein [Paenibacillus sp. S28]MBJ9992407.1 hypothetical protein [Paenibacillus sp. S28]
MDFAILSIVQLESVSSKNACFPYAVVWIAGVGLDCQRDDGQASFDHHELMGSGRRGQDIQSNIVGAYPSVRRAEPFFLQGQYSPDNVKSVPKSMKENTVVMPSFPSSAQAQDLIQPVPHAVCNGKLLLFVHGLSLQK